MKALLLTMLATILGTSPIYAADKIPDALLTQIADGYHVIDFASGDLNQDGVADVALIVEADEAANNVYWRFPFPLEAPYILLDERDQEESDAALRSLEVYFAGVNGSFEHVLSHSHWVDRADMGGMLGDPFDDMSIHNGTILISAWGGATAKWATELTLSFNAQKTNLDDSLAWRMVNYKNSYHDGITGKSTEVDRNLIDYRVKISTYDKGKFVEDVWDVIKNKTPIYLQY